MVIATFVGISSTETVERIEIELSQKTRLFGHDEVPDLHDILKQSNPESMMSEMLKIHD